jgi:hypothetical protein
VMDGSQLKGHGHNRHGAWKFWAGWAVKRSRL